MPRLTYTATGFPKTSPHALLGTHSLDVTWSALVWAAISVGRAGMSHLLRFGLYSAFEMVYRTALMYANLREAPSRHLMRSEAYNALDPSEKAAISYFLGLTVSKLFAERCLQVPWLLHLDVYRTQLRAVLRPGRSKPDLVGQDANGNWVVVESKGRTNRFDETALSKAKAQSRRVRTISGRSPKLRVGMQSYFESSQLCIAVDDPDGEEDEDLIDLPITTEMLIREYYHPFRAWLDQGDHAERVVIEDRVYFVRSEPQFDFAVGLAAKHYQVAPNARKLGAGRAVEQRFFDRFIGKDGVLVQLGPNWSSQRMRQEPEDRLPRVNVQR